jgi:hypothetical protein
VFLFSIIFYKILYCLTYYEHAEKRNFEVKGKVYRMVEVKVKSEEKMIKIEDLDNLPPEVESIKETT